MASYGGCCVSRSTVVSNRCHAWDGILMGSGVRKASSLSLPADDYRHKKFNSALSPKRRSVVPTLISSGRITRTTSGNSATGVAASIRQLKISPETRKMRRFLSESDDYDHAMTVTTTSQEVDSKTNSDEEVFTFYRNAEIGLGAISLQNKADKKKKTTDPPWNWERRLSTEVWPDVSITPVVAPGGNCYTRDHSSSSLGSSELLDSSFRFRVNTVDRTSSWITEQAGRKKKRIGQVKRHTM